MPTKHNLKGRVLAMPDDRSSTLLDRTLKNLRRAWTDLSDTTRHYISGQPRPDLPDDDLAKVRAEMEACIDGVGDEATVRARAAALGQIYMGLDDVGRRRFLSELATEFGVDREDVDQAIDTVQAADDDTARHGAEARLRSALEPRWRALLGRFTTLPEGVKFLVDLRAEMLPMAREDIAIKALSDDLRTMLSAWFDIGLLDLRQIDWNSPAALLEKLIAYESVHAIKSWDDLKNRLESDRRCFGFFHPNMPDEPLIFVEVALVNGMAPSVDGLLDEEAPEIDAKSADSAIFYSISNAQRGLGGISFGNFLIKRVVEVLSHDFPNLKTFATLSPIPGFSRWLGDQMKDEQGVLLSSADRKVLAGFGEGANDAALLSDLLGQENWRENEELATALKEPVSRLAARYLLIAKGRGGRAADPVAHFHLTNGARAERLNWLGDLSDRGRAQSHGVMINYQYRLGDIEANSTAYLSERKIAQSPALRSLAKG
jgi:malonyl-CoA decarboxylase